MLLWMRGRVSEMKMKEGKEGQVRRATSPYGMGAQPSLPCVPTILEYTRANLCGHKKTPPAALR